MNNLHCSHAIKIHSTRESVCLMASLAAHVQGIQPSRKPGSSAEREQHSSQIAAVTADSGTSH
jgi:hypothetical protein